MNQDTPEDNVEEGIEEPVEDHAKEEKSFTKKKKIIRSKKN